MALDPDRDWLEKYLSLVARPSSAPIRETHHILPAKLAPAYASLRRFPWNKQLLSPEEHLLSHYYLFKALPHNQVAMYSFWIMIGKRGFDGVKFDPDLLPEFLSAYALAKQLHRGNMRKLWKDRGNQLSDAISKALKHHHENNPRTREALSEAAIERWSNPSERKRVGQAQKDYIQAHPERRERQSEIMKAYWSSPEGLARKTRQDEERKTKRERRQVEILERRRSPESRHIRSVRSKEAKNTPTAKAAASKNALAKWQNPEFRKRMKKAQVDAWKKRKESIKNWRPLMADVNAMVKVMGHIHGNDASALWLFSRGLIRIR